MKKSWPPCLTRQQTNTQYYLLASIYRLIFPSRRRHTRLVSDWSSDVCSSDLEHTSYFQAEDGIRDWSVTGVQTCALPISRLNSSHLPISYAVLDRKSVA